MTNISPPSAPPPPQYVIGVDEAGRGPLFGRVYAAAVILSDVPAPRGVELKDSKKFHSVKKIHAAEEYITRGGGSRAWAVAYEEPAVIDEINIRRANFRAMHAAIAAICAAVPDICPENTLILVDGNDFIPYRPFDAATEKIREYPYQTVVGGDAAHPCISAASILAKCARDRYIGELCAARPELAERYGIHKNMGYGTKQHIEGIRQWGYTDLHRQTFKPKQLAGAAAAAVGEK